MEQIIRNIVKSQKLKDIGAVVRGADRVLSVYFPQLTQNSFNPLMSGQPRQSPYIIEEEHPRDYEYDSTKKFDFAENPSNKNIEETLNITGKKTITSSNQSFSNTLKPSNNPPGGSLTSSFNRSFSTSFFRNFSVTARQTNERVGSIQPPSGITFTEDPTKPPTNLHKDPNNAHTNPQAHQAMNLAAEKSFNDYQNSESLNDPEMLGQPRKKVVRRNLRERKVPSSAMERTATFAGLGLNIAASAVGGVVKNVFTGGKASLTESILTEENAQKISETFSKMRGIPLKLGQVLSMQEDVIVPKVISKALENAQKSADIMPQSQLFEALERELGKDWQNKFQSFDIHPIAAASIGQVHKAITKDGVEVAVKVQYPGVLESIDSDINAVKLLLSYPNLLPRSFFIDDMLKHIRKELLEECDYLTEARKQMEFRELALRHEGFYVPKVFEELTTGKILTQEFVKGINLDESITALTQDQKNKLGEKIMRILILQLFEFGYMQTDPNPANFFYVPETDTLNMIDFGAAQRFTQDFVDQYMDIIYGASIKNGNMVYKGSKEVGFLSGEENREMLDAHVASVLIIGEPFATVGPFDFGNQGITKQIFEKLPVLLEKRLKPPPQVVYSLHRMLTGGYLMCMKLGSVVHVSKIFNETREQYFARGKKIIHFH